MPDPTLAHDFRVGDPVRGRADAGPNDRHLRGVVTEVGPHIAGHERDVTVVGTYVDTGVAAYVVMLGTEIEHDGPITKCLAHLLREPCPTCAAYIAAGL